MLIPRLQSSIRRLTSQAARQIRPNAFNPLLSNSTAAAAAGAFNRTRSLHSLPHLQHEDKYAVEGVNNLFSKEGFLQNWTVYQRGLINRLNELTGGTDYEPKSTMEIAILTARDPSRAALFNYASQAHNNHFFFDGLSPVTTDIPEALQAKISQSFTNRDNFRMEFLATANAMFGNGWVWLVLDESKNLRILATYNAGTPYGNPYRRQTKDMNTGRTLTEGTPNGYVAPATPAGNIFPLLCVNVWEHAWVSEYGVWGKVEYLERWWDSVDWPKVMARHPDLAIQSGFF